jgi:hypothetical protein
MTDYERPVYVPSKAQSKVQIENEKTMPESKYH